MGDRIIETSNFLSYVLRRRPDTIGIELDSEGWTGIDALISAAAQGGRPDGYTFFLADNGVWLTHAVPPR